MEKESSFVKGQNNKENHSHGLHVRLPAGLMTLAMLATLSPWQEASAGKPDYTPPHPLRQTGRSQPTTQEPQPTLVISQKEQTQIITQKSTESYNIEETDPFSQEGKLENFVAGYALMSKEEKKEIEKQVITDQSGATIFFSKRTSDRLKTPASPLLGMKDQSFTVIALPTQDQENNPLESYINKLPLLSDLSLGEESFVVVDDDGENKNVIVWSIMHPERIREKAKSKGWGYVSPSFTTSLYHNNQPLSLPPSFSLIPNFPLKGILHPFMVRPSWDPKNNQLVYADEVSILANCNLSEIDPRSETVKPIVRETPTLLGDVHSRLKANFKRYLKLSELWKPHTVFFTHPEEIQKYIATGESKYLQHIKLLPNPENPVFFALIGGFKNTMGGFKNTQVVNVLEKAIQSLSDIDPALLSMLNQWGVYIFMVPGGGLLVGSARIYEAYDFSPLSFRHSQYRYHADGTEISEQEWDQRDQRFLKKISDSILTIILSEAHRNYFSQRLSINWATSDREPSPFCVGKDALWETGDFINHFAQKYQDRIDTELYNKLIEYAEHAHRTVRQLMNRE